MKKIRTYDVNETVDFARKFAKRLHKGDILVLSGPLGAGKTAFAKGIASGLGIKQTIVSPTFSLSKKYKSGDIDFLHIDAYRLLDNQERRAGEEANFVEDAEKNNTAKELLADELETLDLDSDSTDSVVLIEWGEGIIDLIDNERIEINIDRVIGSDASDEDERVITINCIGERYKDFFE